MTSESERSHASTEMTNQKELTCKRRFQRLFQSFIFIKVKTEFHQPRTGDLLAVVQKLQRLIGEPTAACQPAQVNVIVLDLLILDEQEHLFTLNSDLVILADGS